MKTHTEICIIDSEINEVFNIVADIESYPEFLPWCVGARITETNMQNDFKKLKADLIIAFGSLREKISSDILINEKDYNIEIFSSDKPFKILQGKWNFLQVEKGCKVSFNIKFEFRSKIIDKLIGLVFFKAIKKIVKAFQQRLFDIQNY